MSPHLERRLTAILDQLKAVHDGAAPTTATRGAEREAFVDLLLRACLPFPYRFGSGEVTDTHGGVSGQIDVVIEQPFFPSFPLLGTSRHRLYVIEGVAIAIEVKSSESQFKDAIDTQQKFRALKQAGDRHTRTGSGGCTSFPGRVGFAIVLYTGWANPETLRTNCETGDVDVAIQFVPPMFYARDFQETGKPRVVEGVGALAAFLAVVTEELRVLTDDRTNFFRRYVDQPPLPPH